MKKILIPVLILVLFKALLWTLVFMQVLPNEGKTVLLVIPSGFILFFFLLKWVKKKYYSDEMSFKEVFVNGVYIGAFSALIMGAGVFVFLRYIDPPALDILKKTADREKQEFIESHGSISATTEKTFYASATPEMQAVNQLAGFIISIIFSLISAAILKTKKQE